MADAHESSATRHTRLRRLARLAGAGDRLPIDPDLAPDDSGEPSPTHRRGAARTRRARPAVLAAILAGGFLGTLARYGVTRALPTPAGGFPAATFLVNATGAFVLGLFLAALLERGRPARLLRPFAATGVLGGWTTYSSMAVDAATLGHEGRVALAAGYLALTLVVGVTASALGIALGRARVRVPEPAGEAGT
ncbi:MAG: fluoride efflux transporter FluC [Acidimicrobiales bacterium]